MDAAAELGRNPASKHQIQPEYGDEQADGTGLPNPSRETKFSGTNTDRGILIFPVRLTTSRIDNLTRLIHTLAICMCDHTYINKETRGIGCVIFISQAVPSRLPQVLQARIF